MQRLGRHLQGFSTVVFCVDHTLKLITDAIVDHPAVRNVIADIREFVTSARASPIIRAALKNVQTLAGVRNPKILIADVKTRWWSTYMMMTRVLEMKPYLSVDDPAFVTVVEFTRRMWSVCRAFVRVLKPLRDAQLLLEGSHYITISWVPSTLELIRQSLADSYADLDNPQSQLRADLRVSDVVASGVRSAVLAGREAFVYHYREPEMRLECRRDTAKSRMCGIPTMAWLAQCCDPRNKHLTSYMDRNQEEKLWYMFLIEMGNMPITADVARATDSSSDDDAVSPTPRRTPAGVQGESNHMLRQVQGFARQPAPPAVRNVLARGQALKLELGKYRRHAPLDSHKNPLSWWRRHQDMYPTIAALARQHLAVQATNAASERLNSEASNIVRANRARLDPSTVEDLLILRGVYTYMDLHPQLAAAFQRRSGF